MFGVSKKELKNKIKEQEEYISVLESLSEKDKNLIGDLRKTINSLVAYKIKANIKINNLKKQIKELEGNDTSK